MTTYAQTVRILHPVIEPVFAALQSGLEVASDEHVRHQFTRTDDPWYYAHTVRRVTLDKLTDYGLQARTPDDRPALAMAGLLLFHGGLAVRVFRVEAEGGREPQVPVPGRSDAKQQFYRQGEPTPALAGMEVSNILLLWRDHGGVLVDPMTLARPLGGGHRRDSLLLDWQGKLGRDMANWHVADLDELEPDWDFRQLGDEGA